MIQSVVRFSRCKVAVYGFQRSIDHKDRDLGTFESLYLECYSTMKNTGSQPCHSSLQLGNANYTGLKCPTAKGTSQIDL